MTQSDLAFDYADNGLRRDGARYQPYHHYLPADEHMIANVGALVGHSTDSIDVEFAIDPNSMPQSTVGMETGIFSVIPTNIFAALSLNDSVRVLIFAVIFGIGMVMTSLV